MIHYILDIKVVIKHFTNNFKNVIAHVLSNKKYISLNYMQAKLTNCIEIPKICMIQVENKHIFLYFLARKCARRHNFIRKNDFTNALNNCSL